MGKVLIIAEKPSVARDIAKAVLTNPQYKEGYIQSEKAIVTWAVGHLAELKMPHEIHPGWKKWHLNQLPILPEQLDLKVCERTQDQFKTVQNLIQNSEVDRLINACDAGREGERIFRNIIQLVGGSKPIQRLWISSMTAEAIRTGFRNLLPSQDFDSLSDSARCRDEADWLTGLNLSRVFTLIQNCGEVFSVGRVQTPTLAMIVQRDREIENFKPEPYWQVKATFGDCYSGYRIIPETEETHIKKEEDAIQILEKILNKPGIIRKIENTKKSLTPYPLHDLTELQREANRIFNYSAAKTLEIAQKLYETRKVITYPRTDSRYLTQDIVKTIPAILQKLSGISSYTKLVQQIPQNTPPKRYISNVKVKDHHAIIPTTGNLQVTLSPEEKNIFDLIVRRFLSVFYPPHLYSITKIWTHCEGEQFLTQGKVVSDIGWKICYPQTTHSEDEETPLPTLKEGESRLVTEATKLDKKTQPPKRYTEGTLLTAMETAGRSIEDEALREAMRDRGLGTPATRAMVLENLKKKNYIEIAKKSIYSTSKAKALIKILPHQIISPELTGEWESRLHAIEDNKESASQFMEDIKKLVRDLVEIGKKTQKETFEPSSPKPEPLPKTEQNKSVELSNPEEPDEESEKQVGKKTRKKKEGESSFPKEKEIGICPKCGEGNIREYPKSYSCNRYEQGCRFTIWKQYARRPIKTTEVRALLKRKETKLLKNFKSKTGSPFSAYLFFDANLEVKLGFENSKVSVS
ncbi:MAG: DNA topoisomerase 3 [Planctomycetota bacterium]